jgi:hypothetical protein
MMEYELEEVERDYIEFRKEMGEYTIEIMKNNVFMIVTDAVTSFS